MLFTLAFGHPQIVQTSVSVRSRNQELVQVASTRVKRPGPREHLVMPTAAAGGTAEATVFVRRDQAGIKSIL